LNPKESIFRIFLDVALSVRIDIAKSSSHQPSQSEITSVNSCYQQLSRSVWFARAVHNIMTFGITGFKLTFSCPKHRLRHVVSKSSGGCPSPRCAPVPRDLLTA
jgi:hypothetical protein